MEIKLYCLIVNSFSRRIKHKEPHHHWQYFLLDIFCCAVFSRKLSLISGVSGAWHQVDSVVIRRRFSSFVTKTVTGVSQGDEKKIINILRVMEIRAAEHKTPTCGLELGTLCSILSGSLRPGSLWTHQYKSSKRGHIRGILSQFKSPILCFLVTGDRVRKSRKSVPSLFSDDAPRPDRCLVTTCSLGTLCYRCPALMKYDQVGKYKSRAIINKISPPFHMCVPHNIRSNYH